MKIKALALTALISIAAATPADAALPLSEIPAVMSEMTDSPRLNNPAIVLMDQNSGKVIYQRSADSMRKPASTLKLLSAVAAIDYLGAAKTFHTSLYNSDRKNEVVLIGESDPWIALTDKEAKDYGRVSRVQVATAIKQNTASRTITIRYSGMYSTDLTNLRIQLNRMGKRVNIVKTTESEALLNAGTEIATYTSPNVQKMLEWTLLWSDNKLAERLARKAAIRAGHTPDPIGINEVFNEELTKFGIETNRVNFVDGSGLDYENKLTADVLAQLLFKIGRDPHYAPILAGLPIGGVSGTMQERFWKSAPNAVGLVKAKTGSLLGTVSMAGYVESPEHEYIFVAIADQIPRSERAAKLARSTLDKILAKLVV
ncbi:MAG: hypothetical protein RL301_417 [Actinomycetota bacterium]